MTFNNSVECFYVFQQFNLIEQKDVLVLRSSQVFVMTKPKSHKQLRRNVCALCYLENSQRATKLVSGEEEKIIKKLISPDFNLHDEKYPTGLCVECHFALYRLKKNLTDSIFISALFGQDIPPALRSVTRCNCAICLRGRLSGPEHKTQARKWKNERQNRVLFYPVIVPEAPVDAPPPDDDVVQPPPVEDIVQPVPDDDVVQPPVDDNHHDGHLPLEQEHHEAYDYWQDELLPQPELVDLIPPDPMVVDVVSVHNLNNNNNTKNSDLEAPEVETSVFPARRPPPPEYLEKNDLGQSLLHLNVQRSGREDKIRDMIERGHPLEMEDNEGCTPLYEAVRNKMLLYVMIIIEAGGHRDHMNKAGETPLIFACKHGCLNEAEYLCDTGAQVNRSNHVGKTALHYLKKHLTAGRRPGCHPDYREPGVMVQLQSLVTMMERRATGQHWPPSPDITATRVQVLPNQSVDSGGGLSPSFSGNLGPGRQNQHPQDGGFQSTNQLDSSFGNNGAPQMLPPRVENEHFEDSGALCSSCNIEIEKFDEFLNVPDFPVDTPPAPDAASDGQPADTDHCPAPAQTQSSAARPRAWALAAKTKKRDLCSYCFSQVSS